MKKTKLPPCPECRKRTLLLAKRRRTQRLRTKQKAEEKERPKIQAEEAKKAPLRIQKLRTRLWNIESRKLAKYRDEPGEREKDCSGLRLDQRNAQRYLAENGCRCREMWPYKDRILEKHEDGTFSYGCFRCHRTATYSASKGFCIKVGSLP